MRKNINTEHIEGRIYQHTLELKTVQNKESANYGTQYINGTIEVAVDEEAYNVIPVEFTYVGETTKKGGKNKTYAEMMKIINTGKTVINDGIENATMVKIDTSLVLNDFVASDDTLVSQVINQGGFVEVVSKLQDENVRNTFKTDIVITGVVTVDANPEKNIENDFVKVRGAVFNFRNELLPVEFAVRNAGGMKYFENLDVSPANPVYTCVWGRINFNKIQSVITEESAFGEAAVSTRERKMKEWTITGASKVPYDFGDEQVMTEEELVKAMQDREIHLANVKKQREEYLAAKNAAAPAANAFSAPTPTVAAQGKFNF